MPFIGCLLKEVQTFQLNLCCRKGDNFLITSANLYLRWYFPVLLCPLYFLQLRKYLTDNSCVQLYKVQLHYVSIFSVLLIALL